MYQLFHINIFTFKLIFSRYKYKIYFLLKCTGADTAQDTCMPSVTSDGTEVAAAPLCGSGAAGNGGAVGVCGGCRSAANGAAAMSGTAAGAPADTQGTCQVAGEGCCADGDCIVLNNANCA